MEIKAGKYHFEWFNPVNGEKSKVEIIRFKTQKQAFSAPWKGPAVLYLVRKSFNVLVFFHFST